MSFVAPNGHFAIGGFDRSGTIGRKIDVGRSAASPHFNPSIKNRAVIVENADINQSLAHREFLVAVLA